jgi:hypothetical protein
MTCSDAISWLLAAARDLVSQFSVTSFGLGGAATLFVLWMVFRRRSGAKSASVGLPFGLGSATFDLTPKDRIAAWRLHVQLVTRKAALPFDPNEDVIADVLASLHELFHVTRDLLLEMSPANSGDQHGVAGLITRVLNMGVRPTLTRWHAGFRRWWDSAVQLPANADRSPQDIQRDYPRYAELVTDIGRMNIELSKFSDELALIAAGGSPQKVTKRSIAPRAPELLPPNSTSAEQSDKNPPPSAVGAA